MGDDAKEEALKEKHRKSMMIVANTGFDVMSMPTMGLGMPTMGMPGHIPGSDMMHIPTSIPGGDMMKSMKDKVV